MDAQGHPREFEGDYFFSSMPVKELVQSLDGSVPANVREVSDGLLYRDFLTVGLLVEGLKGELTQAGGKIVDDNWIYVQEPDVLAGRMQIFNNWSPYMVAQPSVSGWELNISAMRHDELWDKPDAEMIELARQEWTQIGIIDRNRVLDARVIRVPKTYPAYFGTYDRFDEIRSYLDRFENLFLVGRNGMHKYNNQDHSMLTAMVAVDNIAKGITDKSSLWEVNTEMEYHEKK